MSDPRQRRGPGGRPPRAKTTVDPARAAAYDALRAVRQDDAYFNLALPAILGRHGLHGRDAAFATELAAGTLRRQGTYDAVLAACSDRPLARIQPEVLDVLRLGAHQLLAMRVGAHAALDTSVDLVRSRVGQGASGFVNAVLRKVSRHSSADWVRQVAPDPVADPHGFAAVAFSHPRWVVDRLGDALGAVGAAAELDDLLLADNEAPQVVGVARPGRAEVSELAGTPTRWSPYGAVLAAGDPAANPAIAEGRAAVQDEGSQLVALALAAAPIEGADTRWLDLCAGPGGKAALLAALAADRGAHVVAGERQAHRAGLVRRAVAGAGGTLTDGAAGVVVADGTRPPWRAGTFDRVLVDAPCSGLGALRRRPESRWRRRPDDIADLVPLQRDLLGAALDATRPGGVVCYATCSPVLEETVGVVQAVLAQRAEVALVDAGGALGAVTGAPLDRAAGPIAGTVQLWPHRHRTDAMFIALLRKQP